MERGGTIGDRARARAHLWSRYRAIQIDAAGFTGRARSTPLKARAFAPRRIFFVKSAKTIPNWRENTLSRHSTIEKCPSFFDPRTRPPLRRAG